MAQLAQLTTAEYVSRFTDQMSGPAMAAAESMERLTRAALNTEASGRRASASFAALEARLDAGARLAQAKARADERLAAEAEVLAKAVERGKASQEQANRLMEAAAEKRDAYIAGVRRQIQVEGERSRAMVEAAQAAERAAEIQARVAAHVERIRAAEEPARRSAAVQSTVNRFAGVSEPASTEDYARRQADIEAYARSLDEMRAKFVPLAAAQLEYERRLEAIAQAERLGALAAQEAAEARAAVAATLARTTQSLDPAIRAQREAAAAAEREAADLRALRVALDPVYAAQARTAESAALLARQQEMVNRALADGRITKIEHANLLQNLQREHQQAAATAQGFAAANDNAAYGARGFGAAMGQVGFQVQDFATQVSMGQNAMMAFGVQFAQLAGFFGTTGALLGAATMIGVVAAQFLSAAKNVDALSAALDQNEDRYAAITRAAEARIRGIEDEGRALVRLADYYGSLSQVQREFEQRRVEAASRGISDQLRRVQSEVEAGIAALRQQTDNTLRSLEADNQQREARGLPRARPAPNLANLRDLFAAFDAPGPRAPDFFLQFASALAEVEVQAGRADPALRRAREAVDGQIPTVIRAMEALSRLALEHDAVTGAAAGAGQGVTSFGAAASGAATPAANLARAVSEAARSMAHLRAMTVENAGADLAERFERARQVANALSRGGVESAERVRAAQDDATARTEVATRSIEAYAEALKKAEIPEAERLRLLDEYRPTAQRMANDIVDLERRNESLTGQLRESARATRDVGAAVRDTAEAYGVWRMEAAAGLDTLGAADARVIGEIQRAVRASAIDPARMRSASEAAEREAARVAQATKEEFDRTARRWGDSLADATFSALQDGARRGQSPFQALAGSFGTLLRRAVAEALSNLVFQPLVREGLRGIGYTGAESGPGSMLSSVGQMSGLSNLLPGGLTGGVSSILRTPLFGGVSAGEQAFLAAAGVQNPAAVGATTLGGVLGAAGAGFGVGSLLGSFLAGDSPNRQTNGMVGAGVGTAAGMAASLALGPAAPLGMLASALLGGALGGAGGGLIGPGRGFSGGDALVDVGADGLLVATRGVGKSFDELGQTIAGAQQQVVALNAQLAASGLRFQQVGDFIAAIGGGESDNPRDLLAALDAGARDRDAPGGGRFSGAVQALRSDNPLVMKAIQGAGTIQEAIQRAAWVTQVYEGLSRVEEPASAFAQAVEAVRATFVPAVEQARALGLATEGLIANWTAADKAIRDARDIEVTAIQEAIRAQHLMALGREDEARAIENTMARQAQARQAAERLRALGQSPEEIDRITQAMWRAWAAYDQSAIRAREAAEAQEAAAEAQRAAAEQARAIFAAGGSIRQFIDAQRATGVSGASPADQLTAAQAQFGRDLALARGGDQDALGRITGTADRLLAAGSGMYASGSQFQALRQMVLSSLETLPATRSYDAQILAALQALGGSVDVAVEIEVVRVITEAIVALPQADRDRLVQTATVVRTVEERVGRFLTGTELGSLIRSEVLIRSVEQRLGRGLTEAERASLVSGGALLRTVDQALGRRLSDVERATLVENATILRTVSEAMGRTLSPAERSGLVAAATVLRTVDQALGRALTVGERASLVEGATVRRVVEQAMGADLTAAQRAGLLAAGTVVRVVEQTLGRDLTAAERASLVASATLIRTVEQALGRGLTAAERASLVEGAIVRRMIEQAMGADLTTAQRAGLLAAGTVVRTVEQVLGRDLTAVERAAMISAGDVSRTISQVIGRTLTEAERAALVTGGTVVRGIEQVIGRALTEAERASLVAGETVTRVIAQAMGRGLTAAERASLVEGGTVTRLLQQNLGRDLTAAERSALVQGGDVLREIDQVIGRNLTSAERASLIAGEEVLRTVSQAMGRALTTAELASLVAGGTVTRTISQSLGRALTSAELATIVSGGSVLRMVEQALGRALTGAERAQLESAGAVLQTVSQALGGTLTAAEMDLLLDGGAVVQTVQQSLGRVLTASERAALVTAGQVVRSVEDRLGRALTATEMEQLVRGGDVPRLIGQTVAPPSGAALVQPGSVSRTVRQAVETTETIEISRSIDDKLGVMMYEVVAALGIANRYLSAVAYNTERSTAGDWLSRGWIQVDNARDTLTSPPRLPGLPANPGVNIGTAMTETISAQHIVRAQNYLRNNDGVRQAIEGGEMFGAATPLAAAYAHWVQFGQFEHAAGLRPAAFADGGFHSGGLRLVGEEGPELEVTGPARIYSATETATMLRGAVSGRGPDTTLTAEIRALRSVATAQREDIAALRAEVAELRRAGTRTADAAERTAASNERMARDGGGLPVGARARVA